MARMTRASTLNVFVAANLLELEVLQDPQQLDLHAGTGGGDFIEEDRAAVGLHELAHLLADRAGERAGHVAEQFAFQQRFRQAPQATSTNGLSRRPLRRWIARAMSDLPVPLSPVMSTVARVSATLSIMSKILSMRWSWPTMFSMPKRMSSCALSVLFSSITLPLVERPLDRHLQFFVDQRLGEEIERAGADRLDRRFDACRSR